MQEKSIFLVKNQHVVWEKMRKRWGLTEKEGIIVWNYEENREGSGHFFETPARLRIAFRPAQRSFEKMDKRF
jgi:hypothetical protein